MYQRGNRVSSALLEAPDHRSQLYHKAKSNKVGTGQEWLNFGWAWGQSMRIDHDVMNCDSIAQPQFGQVDIDHNNSDYDDDDGQGEE